MEVVFWEWWLTVREDPGLLLRRGALMKREVSWTPWPPNSIIQKEIDTLIVLSPWYNLDSPGSDSEQLLDGSRHFSFCSPSNLHHRSYSIFPVFCHLRGHSVLGLLILRALFSRLYFLKMLLTLISVVVLGLNPKAHARQVLYHWAMYMPSLPHPSANFSVCVKSASTHSYSETAI